MYKLYLKCESQGRKKDAPKLHPPFPNCIFTVQTYSDACCPRDQSGDNAKSSIWNVQTENVTITHNIIWNSICCHVDSNDDGLVCARLQKSDFSFSIS